MASSRLRNCRSLPNERIGKCSNTCGGGYCDNPGPNDPPRHAPLHGGDAAGGGPPPPPPPNSVGPTNREPPPPPAQYGGWSHRFPPPTPHQTPCPGFFFPPQQ